MAKNRKPKPGSPSRQTASRAQKRAAMRSRTAAAPQQPASTPAPKPRIFGLTQRLVALIFVIALLLVSYAATARVYFSQQHQIAQTRQAIEQHEASIATLEEEVERWQDPEFIKIQARERLGWVVPGEIGFRVLGPDGKPYGGGQEIGKAKLPDGEHDQTWWDRMWGSVRTADNPVDDTEVASRPVTPEGEG